ncbi:hypothetical protein BCV72DRAFT_212089, partial [Rhizopus microsporus var. microsporus]
LSMTKLQLFKLCSSRTSMMCISNAMNYFYFVLALVTLSSALTTPRERSPGGCYHSFYRLTFLLICPGFLQYED